MAIMDPMREAGYDSRALPDRLRPAARGLGMAVLLVFSLFHPACRAPGSNPAAAKVFDDNGWRTLVIDGRLRASVDTASWESRLKYAAVMNLPMRFFSKPGRILLIGLAGGSIVKNYRKERWVVEAAEPDSGLTGLARRSFGMRADEAAIHESDARQFLHSGPGRYDIILEDVVGMRAVPSHLMTVEFFESVRTHLNEDGIFGIAFESAGWHDELLLSVSSTLREMFSNVVVLPIAEPPNRFGAIVVIASNSPHTDLARDVDRNVDLDPDWRFGARYQETHAWDNQFVPAPQQPMVQTDARNTLERMFETIDDSARHQPPGYLP